MKVKTSITLSEDLVETIDQLAGEEGSRSEYIEGALRCHIARERRDESNRHDLEVINRRSARLNREAEDVVSFQGEW
jgi:metal-responsive CopG/Arc/MetJ family transcriptional regulator